LGDVVSGLSKALQKKGHLVEIVLPKYDCMQYDRIGDLRVCYLLRKELKKLIKSSLLVS
jgi:glycogen synthase